MFSTILSDDSGGTRIPIFLFFNFYITTNSFSYYKVTICHWLERLREDLPTNCDDILFKSNPDRLYNDAKYCFNFYRHNEK